MFTGVILRSLVSLRVCSFHIVFRFSNPNSFVLVLCAGELVKSDFEGANVL